MYKRIQGAEFTVKTPMEKKELIDVINNSKKIKYMKCIGITPERFTGKILNVLFKMEGTRGKVVSFEASGLFPTLRLTRKDSNNTYVIDVPVEGQVEIKTECPPKIENKIETNSEHIETIIKKEKKSKKKEEVIENNV